MSELRQQAFNESSELKKTISQCKKQLEEQNGKFEEALQEKSMQIEKFEAKIRKLSEH